jgi:branched-subunit amino acid ABC-type transport system permease component
MLRIIGAALGALATYVMLILLIGGTSSQTYLIAVVVGLVISVIFPWVIELMVSRRERDRRRAAADREAQDQLAQRSGGD